MKNIKISSLIINSFKEVKNIVVVGNLQEQHRKRSKNFIEKIHSNLEREFHNQPIQVFSYAKENNDFKRSEYLFDILVAEIERTEYKDIPFVKKAKIIIESEFAQNTRESIIDFSKLIMGKADVKIMVLPSNMRKASKENYLTPLKEAAKYVEGELYLVFIPHPKNWDKINSSKIDNVLQSFIFINGDWQPL